MNAKEHTIAVIIKLAIKNPIETLFSTKNVFILSDILFI